MGLPIGLAAVTELNGHMLTGTIRFEQRYWLYLLCARCARRHVNCEYNAASWIVNYARKCSLRYAFPV